MSDQINQIIINKEPSFHEVWYEGHVEHQGEEHKFWLIHPMGKDLHGNQYECDVRWFFQRVPREVRMLASQIIEAFKQTLKPIE